MKLVELLSEEKIIITEEAVDIPKLTTLSLGDVDYKWNGNSWVKATDNSTAPQRIGKKLTQTFKSFNTGKVIFDAADTVPVQVRDRYLVNLANESFSFAKQTDADKFISRLRGGQSIDRALRIFSDADFKRIGRGTWSRYKIGSAMKPAEIDTAIKNSGGRLTRIFSNSLFQGLLKLLAIFGVSVELYQSFIVNYDTVKHAPDSDFDGGAAEKEELLDVITGLFVSQVVLVLAMAFRAVRAATFITKIRAPIRAIQAGAAATGVGTIPALISMIITEAAFWGAVYLLTRPSVQMTLAKYIANSVASPIFETVGNAADIAAMSLDTITNGALGGATLRDALTFEGGVKKMPTGTAYSSSEWAKIAFQDMIFPPDMEKVKVPYLILGDRTNAIFDALDIDQSERPAESLNPKPMSSGQAGQLSDYIFTYTPEMAEQLKDTHEIIVISDRLGAVPGGSNQELYLAPTPQALASGKPIPMPDNRVLTRSGAKIERDSDQGATQDPIVDIAQDAIDSVGPDPSTSPRRGYERGQDIQQELPSYLQ